MKFRTQNPSLRNLPSHLRAAVTAELLAHIYVAPRTKLEGFDTDRYNLFNIEVKSFAYLFLSAPVPVAKGLEQRFSQ